MSPRPPAVELPEELLEHVRDLIARHGWSSSGVKVALNFAKDGTLRLVVDEHDAERPSGRRCWRVGPIRLEPLTR